MLLNGTIPKYENDDKPFQLGKINSVDRVIACMHIGNLVTYQLMMISRTANALETDFI